MQELEQTPRRRITNQMERVPYYQIPGLEHVYLEDSYVLDVRTSPASVEFSLLVVLREQHPLYSPPLPGEQYCYRNGVLRFANIRRVEWIEKSMAPSTDATGAVDYGNIDEFYEIDEHYYLSGDWGRLEVEASALSLEIQDVAPASL
jgi:hypothetical protein